MSKAVKKGKPDTTDEVGDLVVVSPHLDYFKNSIIEVEEGEEIAVQIMDEVFDKACECMINNYFDHTSIPYTVQCMAKEMLDLIQFIFVGRDDGDEADEHSDTWLPDEEPESVAIDSWARGAVPVRRKALNQIPQLQDSLAMSRGSSPPSRSGRLKTGKTAREAETSGSQQNSELQQSEAGGGSGESTSMESPSAANARTAARRGRGGGRGRGRGRGQQQEEPDPEKQALLEAKRLSEERKLKEIEEAARQEKLLKDLKASGRDYTVDSVHNKVIPIRHVDPKRLPNKKVDMKISIQEEREEQERLEAEVAAKEAARKQGKSYSFGRRNDKKKKKEPKIPPGTWMQPEESAGPMIEEVVPTGGVCVRDGDVTKRSDMKTMKNHMSKQDFKKMVDAANYASGTESMASTMNTAQLMSQAEDKDKLAVGTKGGRPGSIIATPSSGTTTAAAERMKKETNVEKISAKAEKKPKSQQPQEPHQPAPEKPTESSSSKVDDNRNQYKPQGATSVPTNKTGIIAQTQLLGDRTKYPKERTHIHRSVMAEPKHLPAPVYPATTGHGFGQSSGSFNNAGQLPQLTSHGAATAITASNERLAMEFFQNMED